MLETSNTFAVTGPTTDEAQIFDDPAFRSQEPYPLDEKSFYDAETLEAERNHIRANGGKLCHISKPCGICQNWYKAYFEEREMEAAMERM